MRLRTVLAWTGIATPGFLLLISQCLPAENKGHYWGVGSFTKYATIPGATRVGTEACAACHAELNSDFRHAFHAQQGIECEDCHGAGSKHVEGGGDVTKIVSYSKRSARDANGACLSCHAKDESIRNWMAGAHASNDVRCTDCHQVHATKKGGARVARLNFDTASAGRAQAVEDLVPESKVLMEPRWERNEACLTCHQTQRGEISLPYHHPLREGKMDCADCHDPHGGAAGNNLRQANVNQLCLSCHAQYRGPFAYQHPPVTESCMTCHVAHGSPNTNLLQVSEPALCLQCHAGHHNGASIPLADRCTNCHTSIHGTDVPTPSGGSRFVDKGPSEVDLLKFGASAGPLAASRGLSPVSAGAAQVPFGGSSYGTLAGGGAMGMLMSGSLPGFSAGDVGAGSGDSDPGDAAPGGVVAAYSITPGAGRLIHGSGFLGRVGEYDSLEESAGADVATAYVSPDRNLTVVSRGNFLTDKDYSAASELTAGERLRLGITIRSFVQQQDYYPFNAFPLLDKPLPPSSPPLSNCAPSADCSTGATPPGTTFAMVRRLGNAYGRYKVPRLPVHLFAEGNWEARAGVTQLQYLDENANVPISGFVQTCGAQCHYQSQFQQANYTTRTVGGGADVDLGPVRLRWKHDYSVFTDRLSFPIGVFTGVFTPESEGISSVNPPPSGPAPADVAIGSYYINPPSPDQYSDDSLSLSWMASPKINFTGQVGYMRLQDTFTNYRQNAFDSDDTLNWRPLDRLRVTADYHQQNALNAFTPYYSMYGNVSYHDHWEGLRLEYDLPRGFDLEGYYQRGGITRSNAFLWQQTAANTLGIPSQIYSIDNSDLLKVVPASFSNTTGLALHYHDRSLWSARAGYEWTGTHDPGYLTVPGSNNRVFADVWVTPTPWLAFSNDTSVIVQNAFPAIPLLRPDGNGDSGNFQRRNRFYADTVSTTLRFPQGWNLALGYSYERNNLNTYMAFQNLPGVGYFLDVPNFPYDQLTDTYWAESSYIIRRRLGFNLRVTYNWANSGMQFSAITTDPAKLGNAALMAQGACPADLSPPFSPVCFSQGMLQQALNNVELGATTVSEVVVPQWIGQGKAYYLFPRKVEGGAVFYYGSYRDEFNPNLNGVLRIYSFYVGRSW